MKYFLLFAGHPRSGHTLVASILNANPNVYCSNQLNILNNFEQYKSKDDLFNYIKNYSKRQETWKSTTQVPNVPKKEITVIGDKAGHRTTDSIGNNPLLLGKFKQFIDLPIKWIHVVRNSFDNLATWSRLNYESKIKNGKNTNQKKELNIVIEKYRKLNDTIVKLKRSENILTVNHEYVITNMHNTLEKMAGFLEIDFDPKWRDCVRNSVWKKPRITRRSVKWTPQQKNQVQAICNQYEWLNGYYYGSCGGC